MKKTDESIYNIVLASIKRHSMNIKTWEKTKLWEDGVSKTRELLLSRIKLSTEEIPILYILIDQENWTIYSTRAIYFSEQEIVKKIEIENIKNHKFDVARFKGIGRNQIDFITITDSENIIYKVPYETGEPSMAAIYGIQTLRQIS